MFQVDRLAAIVGAEGYQDTRVDVFADETDPTVAEHEERAVFPHAAEAAGPVDALADVADDGRPGMPRPYSPRPSTSISQLTSTVFLKVAPTEQYFSSESSMERATLFSSRPGPVSR